MRFSKLNWTSSDWRTIYRASGNMESQYDLTEMDNLWYVTVYQFGRFVEEVSFETKKAAIEWANTQDIYLEV